MIHHEFLDNGASVSEFAIRRDLFRGRGVQGDMNPEIERWTGGFQGAIFLA
jgi:hypothetical protein